MRRAVFLDRDGALIEERHYLSRVEDVVIFPDTAQSLRRLMDAGFLLFIITNQSGVGRGYFTLAEVENIHTHMLIELARSKVRIEKIYVAPEAPDQPSVGRKPSPHFLNEARDEFGLDLSQSYMVGDKLIDLECGWNAGVKKSLLVRTGYGAKVEKESRELIARAKVVDGLTGMADYILADK